MNISTHQTLPIDPKAPLVVGCDDWLGCPFCGTKKVRLTKNSNASLNMVRCIECGARGPTAMGKNAEARAVTGWNYRINFSAPCHENDQMLPGLVALKAHTANARPGQSNDAKLSHSRD